MKALAESVRVTGRLNFNSVSPERKPAPPPSLLPTLVPIPISEAFKENPHPPHPPVAHAEQPSKVPVYLRIKPTGMTGAGQEDSILPLDDTRVKTVQGKFSQEFSFTRVFPASATQQQVFEEVAGRAIDQFLHHERDGLIFAYGVTNSGKTYTVQGTRENPGIIPQALERIFSLRANTPATAAHVSYLQIYNDQIQDLQDFTPPTQNYTTGLEMKRNLKVKVREDTVLVEGLKETRISSMAEGMLILERGSKELRTNQDNGLNSSSSRSHTVFIIRLGRAKLHIVDLAGSERAKRTKLTGQRQVEASSINSSLSHLMGCLQAMRSNQRLAKLYPDKPQNKPPFRPIPFRECKLTLLFRDCLKANHDVVMIVNASPDPLDFEETQHALRYGEMTRSTALLEVPVPSSTASNNVPAAALVPAGKAYGYDGRRRHPVGGGVVAAARKPPSAMAAAQSQTPRAAARVTSSPLSKSASKIKINFSSPEPVTAATTTAMLMTPGRGTLEEENYELQRELCETKNRLVQMEVELREELGREMAKQMEEMRQRYEARLARTKGLEMEESELVRAQAASYQADLKILTDQVVECEEEMERMREAHAREMEALQRELNAALRSKATSSAGGKSSTPKLVAEEREKVRQLQRELEEEMEAHSMVITDRCQVSDELDRALEREEALRAQVCELEAKLAAKSNTTAAFQLAGATPSLLLSKQHRKPGPAISSSHYRAGTDNSML